MKNIREFILKSHGYDIRELRANDYILIIFSLIVICLLLINLLCYGYGRDQAIFSTVARTMINGGAPYQDAWDFKTPGVYFIYALEYAMFGAGEFYLRVFELFSVLIMFYGFLTLSKRIFNTPWAAVFPCLVAAINYIVPGFWHTAQPESFAATALTWAIVFSTYERKENTTNERKKQFLSWLMAAALYSVSALLKPPLGGGIITSFIIIVYLQYRACSQTESLIKILLPVIAAFMIGGLLPVLLTLSYLFMTDSFDEFYYLMFVYLPHYTTLNLSKYSLVDMFISTNYIWLLRYSRLHLLGLVLMFVLPRMSNRERIYTLHVVGAIMFGIIGIALQAKLFRYHYAATITLSGLLSGWGLWKLWVFVRGVQWSSFYMISVFIFLGLLPSGPSGIYSKWKAVAYRLENLIIEPKTDDMMFHLDSNPNSLKHRKISRWNLNSKANHLVSEWIIKNIPQQSTIFVWGFEPSIYLYSNHALASRYIYNVAQRTPWSKADARTELMADLVKNSPAVVVVQEGDIFKSVTGDFQDSRMALDDFPELKDWLTVNYHSATKIENLEILVRKTLNTISSN